MEVLLTTFLAPLLGGLLHRGGEAAAQAAAKIGSTVWETAESLWEKLWPRVQEDATAREAAEAVAADPEDESAKGALQFRLRSILGADPVLAQELERLLNDAKAAGAMADNGAVIIHGSVKGDRGGVAVGRDVHGGINTGRSK